MTKRLLHAFIDESGQRSASARSSDHFLMSAVIVDDADLACAATLLAKLRDDLGRRPGDTLSWKNLRSHPQRLHVAQTLGRQPCLTISTVVVCKRYLGSTLPTEDHAYLLTVRFLLERLSWNARDQSFLLSYMLAHIVRFPTKKLRSYESSLRMDPTCQIAWSALDSNGGRIDQPSRVEALQLADLTVSASAAAFEPDQFGNTERRYIEALAPRLYRHGSGALTSYGLKLHPWNDKTKAAYPWVAAL